MSSFAAFVEQAKINADTLDPRKVLLTVLAVPFFLVGMLVGALVRTVWAGVTLAWGFVWAAGQLGYDTVHKRDG